MPGSTRNIPNFLKARSAQALWAAMFRTNLAASKEFRYFDIQAVQEKDHVWWYAWYYSEIDLKIGGQGEQVPPGP